MYRVIYRVLKVNTIPFCASTWALVTGTKVDSSLRQKCRGSAPRVEYQETMIFR